MKQSHTTAIGLWFLGVSLGLAVACGSDDDDDDGAAGSPQAGHAGTTSGGGGSSGNADNAGAGMSDAGEPDGGGGDSTATGGTSSDGGRGGSAGTSGTAGTAGTSSTATDWACVEAGGACICQSNSGSQGGQTVCTGTYNCCYTLPVASFTRCQCQTLDEASCKAFDNSDYGTAVVDHCPP